MLRHLDALFELSRNRRATSQRVLQPQVHSATGDGLSAVLLSPSVRTRGRGRGGWGPVLARSLPKVVGPQVSSRPRVVWAWGWSNPCGGGAGWGRPPSLVDFGVLPERSLRPVFSAHAQVPDNSRGRDCRASPAADPGPAPPPGCSRGVVVAVGEAGCCGACRVLVPDPVRRSGGPDGQPRRR